MRGGAQIEEGQGLDFWMMNNCIDKNSSKMMHIPDVTLIFLLNSSGCSKFVAGRRSRCLGGDVMLEAGGVCSAAVEEGPPAMTLG